MWVYATFDSEKVVEKWSATSELGEGTLLLGKVKEMINSSDFVMYCYYYSTEMEVSRKHIHVLSDSNNEIWQRHFVCNIPKGHYKYAGVIKSQRGISTFHST